MVEYEIIDDELVLIHECYYKSFPTPFSVYPVLCKVCHKRKPQSKEEALLRSEDAINKLNDRTEKNKLLIKLFTS